jgi:hypothetical protein
VLLDRAESVGRLTGALIAAVLLSAKGPGVKFGHGDQLILGAAGVRRSLSQQFRSLREIGNTIHLVESAEKANVKPRPTAFLKLRFKVCSLAKAGSAYTNQSGDALIVRDLEYCVSLMSHAMPLN